MSPIDKTGILMIHWSKNKDDAYMFETQVHGIYYLKNTTF